MILRESSKCPYIRTGTLEPMCIKDILTKNRVFFAVSKRFGYSKTHNDIIIGTEVKTIIIAKTSLHSLMQVLNKLTRD